MNDGLQKPKGNWKSTLFGIAWVVAIIIAVYFLIRPEPVIPLPQGWTIWPETGASRTILPRDDIVYVGGVKGLYVIDSSDNAVRVKIPGASGAEIVNAVIEDRNGALWVCMDEGLAIRKDEIWNYLTDKDGLPRGRVASIAATSDGHIWLGTANGAVGLPVDGPWVKEEMFYLTPENGLQHNRVMTIIEDSSSGVWFGTHGAPEGGLSRYADGIFQYWTTSNGLPHANVLCLLLDDSGRIWAGCGKDTVGGAIILSEKNGSWKIENALPADELAGPIVRSLLVDRKGYTWIGSEFNGLTIRKDNETLRILTPDDGLSSGEVLTMRDTDNGTMWIGTLMGALRIDSEAVSSILAKSSYKSE